MMTACMESDAWRNAETRAQRDNPWPRRVSLSLQVVRVSGRGGTKAPADAIGLFGSKDDYDPSREPTIKPGSPRNGQSRVGARATHEIHGNTHSDKPRRGDCASGLSILEPRL
jgi:hypothetical protein